MLHSPSAEARCAPGVVLMAHLRRTAQSPAMWHQRGPESISQPFRKQKAPSVPENTDAGQRKGSVVVAD
jgi:hypothetical protein